MVNRHPLRRTDAAGYVVLSAQPLFNCLARWYHHRFILSIS
jgi:hypothetical protein